MTRKVDSSYILNFDSILSKVYKEIERILWFMYQYDHPDVALSITGLEDHEVSIKVSPDYVSIYSIVLDPYEAILDEFINVKIPLEWFDMEDDEIISQIKDVSNEHTNNEEKMEIEDLEKAAKACGYKLVKEE